MQYVIAIDEGTSSTRATLYDNHCRAVCTAQKPLSIITPEAGHVEQDPMEMWNVTKECLMDLCSKAKSWDHCISKETVLGIGITNQRETTVVWNKHTGQPYYNAIVWSDTRTREITEQIINKFDGDIDYFREKTGLPISTYFSAVKFKWLYDNVPGVKEACLAGDCLFGTVDTWIVWMLTKGKTHVTDVTNASRTLLYNIKDLSWDEELLRFFCVPPSVLPNVKSSSEIYGYVDIDFPLLHGIAIAGIIGDQQASLVGQLCLGVGTAKCTYGTGCFLLINTGTALVHSRSGLLSTIGYQMGPSAPIVYALEGSIAVAGSGLNWLQDNLGILQRVEEIDVVASSVQSSAGVYFVPAFSGLFAPHWKTQARGLISGMTLHTTKAHICRAFVEAICLQVDDVIRAAVEDGGIVLNKLSVDGGISNSPFVMQLQSNTLGIPVEPAVDPETTSRGAAIVAGNATNLFSLNDLTHETVNIPYLPNVTVEEREKLRGGWLRALASL